MGDLAKQRADRLAQQRHRNSKASPVTEKENALILLAWEAGELTEGQAMEALGVDRIGARLKREAGIGAGVALCAALRKVAQREAQP